MSKATFLHHDRSLLTCMVQARMPDEIKALITASIPEGAEAFGMQFSTIAPECRNRETYQDLFSFAAPYPVYVTNYRNRGNQGKSDETLAKELLELAECGAVLCDMMGDYFDPSVDELTMNPEAIRKQMQLVDSIHACGAEVLMSSHTKRFLSPERVLEIALEHQKRGADISKIVVQSSNMEEQLENLKILGLLKENLKISFLFLTGGECHIARRLAGSLGNCMTLCVHEYDAYATKAQPLLKDMKAIRDYMEDNSTK